MRRAHGQPRGLVPDVRVWHFYMLGCFVGFPRQARDKPLGLLGTSDSHRLYQRCQMEPSLSVFRRSQPRASSRVLWRLWACPGDSALPQGCGRIHLF